MIDHERGWLHIHIPKTAGTSLRTALMPQYDRTHHEVADTFSKDDWERCTVYSFIRNPYDRALSSYTYHVKTDYRGVVLKRHPDLKELSFHEYVDRFMATDTKAEMFLSQVTYLTHSHSDKAPDFIGRFETLDEDYARLAELLDVDIELPHLLKSTHAAYRDAYDEPTRRLVGEVYAEDLERFGYEF